MQIIFIWTLTALLFISESRWFFIPLFHLQLQVSLNSTIGIHRKADYLMQSISSKYIKHDVSSSECFLFLQNQIRPLLQQCFHSYVAHSLLRLESKDLRRAIDCMYSNSSLEFRNPCPPLH